MEVTLPSGRKATLRDTFLRGDRRAARRALKITILPGGERHLDLSSEDDVMGAILRRMIVSWDAELGPMPRDAQTDEMAQQVLDNLPDDDYSALAAAIRPFYQKVMSPDGGSAADPNSSSATTGTSTSGGADGQETPST